MTNEMDAIFKPYTDRDRARREKMGYQNRLEK